MQRGVLMSLMSNREATGLSIEELSNRLASLYNSNLSKDMIRNIEAKKEMLKEEDAKMLAEFFNTTADDVG